jgi:hypothetical protein
MNNLQQEYVRAWEVADPVLRAPYGASCEAQCRIGCESAPPAIANIAKRDSKPSSPRFPLISLNRTKNSLEICAYRVLFNRPIVFLFLFYPIASFPFI